MARELLHIRDQLGPLTRSRNAADPLAKRNRLTRHFPLKRA